MSKAPRWDLSDLYQSLQDPQIEKDLKVLGALIEHFKATYRNQLERLSVQEWLNSLEMWEKINDLIYKISTFAHLNQAVHETNTEVSTFVARISDRLHPMVEETFFYDLEVAHVPEEKMKQIMSDEKMQKYAYYFYNLRKMRPHNLEEDMEQLSYKKDQTGATAFIRLYDEQKAAMRFQWKDASLNDTQMTALLVDSQKQVRRQAGKELVRGYSDKILLFSRIFNTLLKDKQINDEIFHFKTPMAARNLSNDVTEQEVQALVKTVIKNAPDCSHAFYHLKSAVLNLNDFTYWDRNAPLQTQNDKTYTWEEAREIVLKSYFDFSPKMGQIAQLFFENNWIDAAVYEGKRSGAFASSGPASVHPYLMVNFLGHENDVMTLAHEMGHGIHQYLSRQQGSLMKGTSLNMAETASIFGEMLVFKNLLKQTTDEKSRFFLLSEKVSEMINASFRQIAFHRFEEDIHFHRRQKGELTPDDFRGYFLKTQQEVLGPSVQMNELDATMFAAVPHFIHSPFYVYSYAFAECLVDSLYQIYEEKSVANFEEKYIALLAAGGSQSHHELLAPFGLDTTQADFWQKGLNVIKEMMNELNRLYDKIYLKHTDSLWRRA